MSRIVCDKFVQHWDRLLLDVKEGREVIYSLLQCNTKQWCEVYSIAMNNFYDSLLRPSELRIEEF